MDPEGRTLSQMVPLPGIGAFFICFKVLNGGVGQKYCEREAPLRLQKQACDASVDVNKHAAERSV